MDGVALTPTIHRPRATHLSRPAVQTLVAFPRAADCAIHSEGNQVETVLDWAVRRKSGAGIWRSGRSTRCRGSLCGNRRIVNGHWAPRAASVGFDGRGYRWEGSGEGEYPSRGDAPDSARPIECRGDAVGRKGDIRRGARALPSTIVGLRTAAAIRQSRRRRDARR